MKREAAKPKTTTPRMALGLVRVPVSVARCANCNGTHLKVTKGGRDYFDQYTGEFGKLQYARCKDCDYRQKVFRYLVHNVENGPG
jgi:hypothetical protein